MKKVFFLALCALAFVSVNAKPRTNGSFDVINGAPRVGIKFDFDRTLYDGTAFNTFLAEQKFSEGDWRDIQYCDLYADFVASANEVFGSRVMGIQEFIKAPYYILVCPGNMTSNGEIAATIFLHSASDDAVIASVELVGKGGKKGSWSALLGDGFANLGVNYAKFILKQNPE